MSDIIFDCPHCENHILIDERGIGLELPCPHCQQLVTIRAEEPSPDPAFELLAIPDDLTALDNEESVDRVLELLKDYCGSNLPETCPRNLRKYLARGRGL